MICVYPVKRAAFAMNYAAAVASLIFNGILEWSENSLLIRRQLNRANASSYYFCRHYHASRALFGASVEDVYETCATAEIAGDNLIATF